MNVVHKPRAKNAIMYWAVALKYSSANNKKRPAGRLFFNNRPFHYFFCSNLEYQFLLLCACMTHLIRTIILSDIEDGLYVLILRLRQRELVTSTYKTFLFQLDHLPEYWVLIFEDDFRIRRKISLNGLIFVILNFTA